MATSAGRTLEAPPRDDASRVRATARIEARPDGRGGTALPLLAGSGPLAPRRTRSRQPGEAHVTLVGAMSAPLGGDRLAIDVTVTPGADLRVTASGATLALPGTHPAPAHYDTRLTVGDGATLRWLPEPVVSVQGSELRQTTVAELASASRLLLREEQVLGRHGELSGRLTSRLTVRRAGRPLLDQELDCGTGAAAGWDGPAVLAGRRAVGQLLLVQPEFERSPVRQQTLGEYAALTPLAGPAALVTAVAPDALTLRTILETAALDLLDVR
ncbi:Urease accessory protein UreD [Streptomyces sp. YIM 130001]|uniref:urease accessory protein UreD n=1 Tax=Streptomyces sp. YIM 130001 TaxID=2259644 RepID=UPI000E65C503|nr:urease accessory protein UreD [Streptomyces sp. YIM 130001]RII13903.1 Urease accessory protein UreD [Streptomyces sp. YIM 130001]